MRPCPNPISSTRLGRLTRYVGLSLQWLAMAFAALSGDRALLDRAAHAVAVLVFFHAANLVRVASRRRWRQRGRSGLVRAAIGSRLRRALRARDPATRFFAMLSVMRDLPAHAARLARRLHRGLTRLYGKCASKERTHTAPISAPPPRPCAINSS